MAYKLSYKKEVEANKNNIAATSTALQVLTQSVANNQYSAAKRHKTLDDLTLNGSQEQTVDYIVDSDSDPLKNGHYAFEGSLPYVWKRELFNKTEKIEPKNNDVLTSDSVFKVLNSLINLDSLFDSNTVLDGTVLGDFNLSLESSIITAFEDGFFIESTVDSNSILKSTSLLNDNDGSYLYYQFYAKSISGNTNLHLAFGNTIFTDNSHSLSLTSELKLFKGKILIGSVYPDRIAFFTQYISKYFIKDLRLTLNSESLGILNEIDNIKLFLDSNLNLINTNKVNIEKNISELSKINGVDNVLPLDSLFDENSVVTSDSVGVSKSWRDAIFSYNAIDKSIQITPSNLVASGIRFSNILELIPDGFKFDISFEAKHLGQSQRITLFIESGISSTSVIDLTDEFQEFNFYELNRGTEYNDGRLTIGVSEIDSVNPFEIRNLKISYKGNIDLDLYTPYKNTLISIDGDSKSTNSNNAYEKEVLNVDVGEDFSAYVTYYDVQSSLTIGGYTVQNSDIGNIVTFTPLLEDVGKKIGKTLNYNSIPIWTMWWQKLADHLQATILQNGSWSGRSVTSHNEDNLIYKTSSFWHDASVNRLMKRDDQGNEIHPDLILVYLGTNDFSKSPYSKLTDLNINSTFLPETDVLESGFGFKEGFALGIKKRQIKYPNSRICVCTLNYFKRINVDSFPVNNGTNTLPEYNNAIKEVCELMGVEVIPFHTSAVNHYNIYPKYASDSSTNPTHENITGHSELARIAIKHFSN